MSKCSLLGSVQGQWLQTSLTGSTFKVAALPEGFAPGDEVSSPLTFLSLNHLAQLRINVSCIICTAQLLDVCRPTTWTGGVVLKMYG